MIYSILEVIFMANKELKTRTPISNAVDIALWEKLKNYSEKTGIPLSKLLDKSIALYLESVSK